jgi:hypothetical protein
VFAQFVLLVGVALMPGTLAQQGQCVRALSALAVDSVPLSENFAVVDCPPIKPAAAFRHDSMQGSSRLSRPVAQNEIVPLFPEFGLKLVQPGQMLRLTILSGAARIERQVEVLQVARPGQKLFVRSSDGQVLSVRYKDQP